MFESSIVPLMHDHPVLRGDDWWSWPTPHTIFDQHFGLPPLMHPFRRPGGVTSGSSEVINDDERFDIQLDVSHFRPEELKVKTVDRTVMIEGKHEERMDEHGFISRQFTRKYVLPKEVDPSTVVSSLSSDGTMTIHAPKMQSIKAKNERVIPIQQTSSREQKKLEETNKQKR